MPSDKTCCVPGCFEAGASHPTLHLFPNPAKDPDRYDFWVSCVGGHILQLPKEHVYKNRRVCHAHFEQRFCCRYNRLSNIAVPSLNLADENGENTELILENPPVQHEDENGENIELILENPPVLHEDENGENIELILENPPVQHEDENGENIELILENPPIQHEVPELVPSSISRKRPISSIDLPSTSKDFKKTKTTVKIMAKTLAENSLNKKLVAARMKLSKYKNKIKKQAVAIKMANNIMTNPSTLKALENLPKRARILTLLQFRENKKKNRGRRFTYDEKIVALSLLKQSPKGYRLLRKIFILPAPQTLIKLITQANIQPGINTNIFAQMKTKAEKMKPCEKICVLLFDEMALKSNITYNERLDKVIGFVNNGEETTKEFADHAQVFMIRGLLKNYKQPIGYTFSASATKGPELAKQIKLYVREITKAGLTVVATICDQGSGNRNAIKCLIEETRATCLRKNEEPKNNIILVDETEIVPLYDTPHLMKCIRNNLMAKDLKYIQNNETKIAKWSHIEQLYDENPAYQGIRLIPKLTEGHVKPAKISKMKVKFATQLFSRTVATNMGYLADKNVIPRDCKDTADILLFFDTLFDTLNGSFNKKRHAKPALGPVTPNSVHHNIWRESKNTIKTMAFLNKGKTESVPTLNNWVWTLDGVEVLCKILAAKHSITSIWTRHLNQDPLENFFGSIRSHGCRNTNPTPERFQSAFATLLVNSLSGVHAPGNNCEDDVATSLHALIINKESNTNNNTAMSVDFINEISLTPIETKLNNPTIKAGLEYCSGYFAKKSKDKVFKKCLKCKANLIDENESEYIKYREFQGKRWLCSPTKELMINISEIQDVIYDILIKKIQNSLIKELIKTMILMLIDFNYIECDLHKEKLIDFIISLATRFFIHNYCKNINNILCGKRNIDDNEDLLQVRAKKFFEKSLKRKT